jgi:hypothetical protein
MEDALLADRTGVGRGRQGSVRPSKLHSLDFKVDFVVNRVSQTRKTLESGGEVISFIMHRNHRTSLAELITCLESRNKTV